MSYFAQYVFNLAMVALPAPFIAYFISRAASMAYFRSKFEYEQRRSETNG